MVAVAISNNISLPEICVVIACPVVPLNVTPKLSVDEKIPDCAFNDVFFNRTTPEASLKSSESKTATPNPDVDVLLVTCAIFADMVRSDPLGDIIIAVPALRSISPVRPSSDATKFVGVFPIAPVAPVDPCGPRTYPIEYDKPTTPSGFI